PLRPRWRSQRRRFKFVVFMGLSIVGAGRYPTLLRTRKMPIGDHGSPAKAWPRQSVSDFHTTPASLMTTSHDPRPDALPEIDGAPWGLNLSHRYATELVGLHAPWQPSRSPQPHWLAVNRPLAEELGLDAA